MREPEQGFKPPLLPWSQVVDSVVRSRLLASLKAPPAHTLDVLAVCERLLQSASRIGPNRFAASTKRGRTLYIEVAESEITFHEAADHGDHDSEEIDELLWTLARPLATTLRWELFTQRGVISYTLTGACTRCEAPTFDDETECPSCEGRARRSDVAEHFVRLMRDEGVALDVEDEAISDRIRRLFRNGIDNTPARMRNEVACLIGGPIEISDKRMRVLAAWARRGGSLEESELFVLRAPRSNEASTFHAADKLRPMTLAMLASWPAVVRSESHHVVLHGRSGHALVVRQHSEMVCLTIQPQSLRGDRFARAELVELAKIVAVTLQDESGWYVFEKDRVLSGFEPSRPCVSCSTECFEQQASCAVCGLSTRASLHDCQLARRVLAELVRARHIEIASDVSTADAEVALASALDGDFDVEHVVGSLFDIAQIDEVFADDATLRSSLRPIVDAAALSAINDRFFLEATVTVFESCVEWTISDPVAYAPPPARVIFRSVCAVVGSDDPNELQVPDPFLSLSDASSVAAFSVDVPPDALVYCLASNRDGVLHPMLYVVAEAMSVSGKEAS